MTEELLFSDDLSDPLFRTFVMTEVLLFSDLSLRPYQLEGVNWLLSCYDDNHGCILGDEMGLGKTCQVQLYTIIHVFLKKKIKKKNHLKKTLFEFSFYVLVYSYKYVLVWVHYYVTIWWSLNFWSYHEDLVWQQLKNKTHKKTKVFLSLIGLLLCLCRRLQCCCGWQLRRVTSDPTWWCVHAQCLKIGLRSLAGKSCLVHLYIVIYVYTSLSIF